MQIKRPPIPFLGLLLALVRPDGAIFGVIGSAIFLFSVHSKEFELYVFINYLRFYWCGLLHSKGTILS